MVWPARLMLPIGFFLLILQGVSELIKRIAFLRGLIPDPSGEARSPTDEELLAEELRRQRGRAHDRVPDRRTWRRSCSRP